MDTGEDLPKPTFLESILKMKATGSSHKLVQIYQNIQHHITEKLNPGWVRLLYVDIGEDLPKPTFLKLLVNWEI
jgi:hypothetical protein